MTTLEGCPQKITGDFKCSNNNLIRFKKSPFEFGPSIIGGDFYCENCRITTFLGIEHFVKYIGDGKFGKMYCSGNHITSHLLGLLCINNLKEVICDKSDVMYKPMRIVNEFLQKEKLKERVFNCQDALIDAGFGKYGQL